MPRAATRAAAANLSWCCVVLQLRLLWLLLLCGLGARGPQSASLTSQCPPRRCPTRLCCSQCCQWPLANPGRELVPCSLGGLGISSIDGFGPVWPPGYLRGNPARGKLSGPPPNPSSLVGKTLGWRGRVWAQPALPEITLASPRPLEAALQGGGPKGPSTGCSISATPDFRACARVNIKNNSVLSPLVEFINAQTIETIEMIENLSLPQTVIKTRKHL